MFCENCGAQLPDGSKFCGSCGSVIAASAAAADSTSTYETNAQPQSYDYTQSQAYDNSQSQYQQSGYQNYDEPQGARVISAEDSEAYAMAGSSLKFGILSACFSWIAILGIIFGINGITKFRKANRMGSRSPKKYVGLGLSIYGLVLSAVFIFYFLYVALIMGVAVSSYVDASHNATKSAKNHDKEISKIIEEIEAEY